LSVNTYLVGACRKVRRLLALEDAIDIGGGATKNVYLVGSVGKQSAVYSKGIVAIDPVAAQSVDLYLSVYRPCAQCVIL
jgi:hypothetical protein